MNTILKRCLFSFFCSAMCGLIINLVIDLAVRASGAEGFISMSPEYLAHFPNAADAAYVNVLLYGIIGASFAGMTVIYESRRIGILLQSLLYFLVTAAVWVSITVFVWQLHRYPRALFSTLAGYACTYLVMILAAYRRLREDVTEINSLLKE